MILDDIATHLTTGGMSAVYKDHLPTAPDTATAVYATGGLPPVHTMVGPHVLEQPGIQIVTRSASLQTARQNAKAAYELLNGLRNTTINSVLYHWVTAAQEPFLIGRDENARFAVACNYDVKKNRST